MTPEEQLKDEQLATFVQQYIYTLKWSECDPDTGENFELDDLSEEAEKEIEADCWDFFDAQYDYIKDVPASAGHDFALTRNRHGAGFWCGEWGEHGDALTDAAHAYGTQGLYLGDDELLYTHS
jgi:hypothetical protein